ncbi:MAG: hypothetical protein ACOYIF_12415 [Acetivibrionales bacterium]
MAKKFDPAYKLEVCKQVESGAATIPEISKETGIHEKYSILMVKALSREQRYALCRKW